MAAPRPWGALLRAALLLQALGGARAQFLLRSPPSVVIQAVGEDAVLPCYLAAPGVPASLAVRWTLLRALERIQVSSFHGRTGLEEHGKGYEGRAAFFGDQVRRGNLSLKLRSIRVSDKGKYACAAAYSRWSQETYVELDVIAPYRSLPWTSPVVGVLGRDVLLPCLFSTHLTGDFVAQWKSLPSWDLIHEVFRHGATRGARGGEERYEGRTEVAPVELYRGNLSLALKNVTEADKGRYLCSLESGGWRDESVVELDVTGQFHILRPTTPIVSSIGADVTLPCRLSPAVLPGSTRVRWAALQPRGPPREISSGGTVQASWLEERTWGATELLGPWGAGDASLRLENVQAPDSGTYVCSVAAGEWHDEVAVELEVTVAPPAALASTYVAAATGSDVVLVCSPPGAATVTSVEWLRSDPLGTRRIISSSSSSSSSSSWSWSSSSSPSPATPRGRWVLGGGGLVLALRRVRGSDAGVYVCRVGAGSGRHEEAFEVGVG